LGGQVEVEKLIKEQFGVLMYANGKGQVINRAEYLRWKFRGQEQVMFILHECIGLNSLLLNKTYFFVVLFALACFYIYLRHISSL
jgi:hypothetical protein